MQQNRALTASIGTEDVWKDLYLAFSHSSSEGLVKVGNGDRNASENITTNTKLMHNLSREPSRSLVERCKRISRSVLSLFPLHNLFQVSANILAEKCKRISCHVILTLSLRCLPMNLRASRSKSVRGYQVLFILST